MGWRLGVLFGESCGSVDGTLYRNMCSAKNLLESFDIICSFLI